MRLNGLRILASQFEDTVGEAQTRLHNALALLNEINDERPMTETERKILVRILEVAKTELERLY